MVGTVGMVSIPTVGRRRCQWVYTWWVWWVYLWWDGAGVSGYAGMCASRALAVPPSHPLISTLVCIVSHYNVKCITYIICIARATAQLPRMISTIVHTQHCVKCPPMYWTSSLHSSAPQAFWNRRHTGSTQPRTDWTTLQTQHYIPSIVFDNVIHLLHYVTLH